MTVGTINVGNDSLAANISSFVRSFAGTLGITAKTDERDARNLGVRLAKPLLKFLGGRFDVERLNNSIDSNLRINNPSITNFFGNDKFNDELFLDNPLRPVLDEAYNFGVSQRLEWIGNQVDKDKILTSIASDLVNKLKARGLFAHAANDDSNYHDNLVNLPFAASDHPGLNVLESGRPALFFDSAELAKATIHQRPKQNDKEDISTIAVKNILAYATINKKTNEVLKALNRFIDLQFIRPDHQV